MQQSDLINTEEITSSFQKMYLSQPNLQEYWAVEGPTISRMLPLVASEIAFNFRIKSALNVGGGGIILIIHDLNLKKERALKISRPSPGKQILLAKILSKEIEALKRLSHPNLMPIYAQGTIKEGDTIYPYYVMDYIPGVQDANEYLSNPDLKESHFLHVIRGILLGIQYIHMQGTIHMDIKPGNILVSPIGDAIISDLGFAKTLRLDDEFTLIGGTEGFIHPEALTFLTEVNSDPNRFRGEAPHFF